VKWRTALPTAAAACYGGALALEASQPDLAGAVLGAGIGLFIAGSFLGGAWIALLAITHDRD
jgi:hypothetical protein